MALSFITERDLCVGSKNRHRDGEGTRRGEDRVSAPKMDLGANGDNSAVGSESGADISVADSSAEAEVMAANIGSVETEQSFLEEEEEEDEGKQIAAKKVMEKSELAERNDGTEDGLSSQDEGATSQDEEDDDDDEEVILKRGGNALAVMDMRECPKVDGVTVVRPRLLKTAEDTEGEEDKENENVDEDDEVDDENEGQEEGEGDADENVEEDEEEDDPLVAGAIAAKANGSVDEWVNYLDETDPCHRLRSLCKKGDIAGLTQLLWVTTESILMLSRGEHSRKKVQQIRKSQYSYFGLQQLIMSRDHKYDLNFTSGAIATEKSMDHGSRQFYLSAIGI